MGTVVLLTLVCFYSPPDVWLLGDSIVFWAGVRAVSRHYANLRLPGDLQLGWYGIRGMSWGDFLHSLQLRVLFEQPPKMIIINLGGNDLISSDNLEIMNWIVQGIHYLHSAFPDAFIVWSDILQRLTWGNNYQSTIQTEYKRRRINRFGRHQVRLLQKGDILVHDIDFNTPGFFRNDGIHLSNVGLDMYLDAIREKIMLKLC